MIDKARIEDLLRQLGGTADEVAASLHTAGVTGIPDESHRCPVANYIRSCAPADARIRADGELVCVRRGEVHVDVSTPDAVAEFIAWLDRGAYPDLDAEAGEPS